MAALFVYARTVLELQNLYKFDEILEKSPFYRKFIPITKYGQYISL